MADFQLVPIEGNPFAGETPPAGVSLPSSSFAGRLEAYGEPAADIEDRRNDPKSGYDAMRANLDYVGAAGRHIYPLLREFDANLPQPKYQKRQPGRLSEDAGYHDIPSDKMPWSERLKKDFDYTFFEKSQK